MDFEKLRELIQDAILTAHSAGNPNADRRTEDEASTARSALEAFVCVLEAEEEDLLDEIERSR